MKTARDYQVSATDAVLEAPGKTALVELASGLGKTYLFARLAYLYWEACGKRILFLVDINEALDKACAEFKEQFEAELEAGDVTFGKIYGGKAEDHREATVVFANFVSLGNRLNEFYEDHFGLILVDECHHACAPEHRYVLSQLAVYDQMVGGTATLRRADGQKIEEVFGEPVYRYGLAKALADGKWLAEVDYRVLTDNLSLKKLRALLKRAKQGDRRISRKQIDRTIFLPERLKAVHRKVMAEQRKGKKKTVIFCRSIAHLKKAQKVFKTAIPLHSDMVGSEQKENYRLFEQGKKRILLVVDKLNEAIDIPDVDLLVFLRGTESERIWRQQLGRGLRLKDHPVVVMDFVANCDRMYMIRQLASEGHALVEDEVIEFDTRFNLSFVEDLLTLNELLDRLRQHPWEESFERLVAFKEEHGHCNVPYDYPRDPRLGKWVHNQRTLYKNGKLSKERIARLQGIDFVWGVLDAQWEESFERLVAFKEEHGHCNVPLRYVQDPKLGNWVVKTRVEFRRQNLFPARTEKLEAIGFVWSPYQAHWEEMFERLVAFKEEHGHCNVPKTGEHSDKKLAHWCVRQRKYRKADKLTALDISRLSNIGFIWDPRNAQWEEMFERLVAFKEEHGHCNVSRAHKVHKKLYVWIKTRRKDYMEDVLSDERRTRLEAIGFIWDPRNAQWEESFERLVAFKEEHGHCNVPNKSRLGAWVNNQRLRKRKKKLSTVRIQRLEAIGFVWGVLDAQWEEMFERLVAFKEEHGHCNVPNQTKGRMTLGSWVSHQRGAHKRGRLSDERCDRLEAIGFVWWLGKGKNPDVPRKKKS